MNPGIQFHGGNRRWAAEVGQCQPETVLDFSASLNPLGPPTSVRQALGAEVESQAALALSTYPDPDSHHLRQALSTHYSIDPDWIMVGNGAAELLTWAARACTSVSETYLIVPAFRDYSRALAAVSIVPQPIPLPLNSTADHHPTVWSLKALLHPILETRGSKALWLNNPHNPTGYYWSMAEILDLVPQFDLVIVDEAFMDFLPTPESPPRPEGSALGLLPWIEQFPQLVVIRSLTKFFTLPGLRIGFAVSHPSRLSQWCQWRDPWSVNGLATVAGVTALQDHPFQQQTYQWLPVARQDLWQGLNQLPGFYPLPTTANFVLAQIDYCGSWLQRALLEQSHVLIRDCRSFPELGEGYVRLAVRTLADHQTLFQACHNLIADKPLRLNTPKLDSHH